MYISKSVDFVWFVFFHSLVFGCCTDLPMGYVIYLCGDIVKTKKLPKTKRKECITNCEYRLSSITEIRMLLGRFYFIHSLFDIIVSIVLNAVDIKYVAVLQIMHKRFSVFITFRNIKNNNRKLILNSHNMQVCDLIFLQKDFNHLVGDCDQKLKGFHSSDGGS